MPRADRGHQRPVRRQRAGAIGGWSRGFDLLRFHGYDPRLVHLVDPSDAEPSLLGDTEPIDVESQAGVSVTITERTVRRYRALLAQFHESVREYCRRQGIVYLPIPCDMAEDEVFLRVLGCRRRHNFNPRPCHELRLPASLALAAPAGARWLLYWLRVGVPRRVVGTGQFWQRALAEEKGRWRWRRWRSKVSLAVQMLIVILLTLAAAGPQIPSPKRIVLILDNSATMRATDVQPTRLDAAKAVALRLIEGLRSWDEMAVVTVGSAPSEIQPLTSNPGVARGGGRFRAGDGGAAGDRLGHPARPRDSHAGHVVAAADRADHRRHGEGSRRAGGRRAVSKSCGSAPRRATWQLLASPCASKAEPTKCEVFVEVRNQGDPPAAGAVTLEVDKNLPSPAVRGAGDGNLLPSSAERGQGVMVCRLRFPSPKTPAGNTSLRWTFPGCPIEGQARAGRRLRFR